MIDESRRFDIMNLDGYDIIMGTPFMLQLLKPKRGLYDNVSSYVDSINKHDVPSVLIPKRLRERVRYATRGNISSAL